MGKFQFSLTTFMALGAAALIVPFVLFVLFLISQLEMREQADLRFRSYGTATSIAFSVERNLRDMTATLRILATGTPLRQGDMAGLHQSVQPALGESSWNLIAVDREGNQLLNTRVPFGTALGKTSSMESLQAALAGDRAFVSEVFFGRTSQRWVFNVIQPVADGGPAGVAALILTQDAQELASLLNATPLPPSWTAAIVDQAGRLVASTGPSGTPIGEELPIGLRNAAAPYGTQVVTLDGEPTVVGFAAMAGLSWRAVVWGPVSTGQNSVFGGWQNLFLGGLAIALAAAASIYLLASRLRRAVRGLSGMALAIGAGELVPPIRTGIRELDNAANALSDASFDRSEAEDKLILVTRELVHRTKNMLTLVQSMIRQSARGHTSIDEMVPVVSQRLAGLAQSIDLLTQQGWEGVSLRELIRVQLQPFGAGPDRLVTHGPDLLLRPEAVQNLGLVLHELATNAVKHGALSNAGGRVEVSWRDDVAAEPAVFVLTWRESGGPTPKAAVNAEGKRAGFGSIIIGQHAEAAFSGKVRHDLEPSGLVWELTTRRALIEWDAGQKTAKPQRNAA